MRRYILISILMLPIVVMAAPLPDAGALRQQIEQNQQQTFPHKAMPEKPAEPPAMQAKTGIIVTVKSFRFVGNTLVSNKKLTPVVASYLNRPLDFTQLQAAAAAIANAYREAGWIVRAYLPAQDIADGIVTIQIVEAVFGGIHINGDNPQRMSRDQIMRIFEAQQKVGMPLSADKLDRALLLADDLPGVTVGGILSEGRKERETDINLKLGDEPLAVGEVGADNTGARSTGSNRVTVNLNLNSPFKHGDLVSANVVHTQGSDYLRLDGNVPIGPDGWRTGINASALNYRLVAPEFTSLDANGTSDTVGLEATYPIIRSRLKNLYLNVNADNKTFNNLSSGAITTSYKADTLALGIEGNLFDNLWGGGANSASISLVDGVLNLDGSPNQAADATTTQTAGQFSKIRYSASRQQVITEKVSFFGSITGQQASKNLDSSEKFYLGGATGVRAYPANEAGGAEGQLANLELRWRLPRGFSFSGFYDYGQITINPNNNFTGASALNEYSLKGAGLSLAWQSEKGSTIKASYARRIGDNPNPAATGTDQDGSFVRDRLWLWVTIPFSVSGNTSGSAPTSSSETRSIIPPKVVSTPVPVSSSTYVSESTQPVVSEGNKTQLTSVPLPVEAAQTNAAGMPVVAAVAQAVSAISIQPELPQAVKQFTLDLKGFGIGSNKLLVESGALFTPLVKYAQEHPYDRIEIGGYTDKQAHDNAQFNLKLSWQRAEAVKAYLVKQGVTANLIATKGHGSARPVASNETTEGQAKNRRVEIRFIPPKANAPVAAKLKKAQK